MKRLCTLVLVVLSLSLAACGGDDDGGDGGGADAGPPFQPLLSEIQTNVFNASCIFSSCHSSARAAGGLILEDGMSRSQLVGVMSANTAAAAMNLERVTAGDGANSFLVIKLRPGLDSTLGSLMPQGSVNGLDPISKVDAIEQWIDDGAADN